MLIDTGHNPLVCHLTSYPTYFLEALGTFVIFSTRTSIPGINSSGYKAKLGRQLNRDLFSWTTQSLNFILTQQTGLTELLHQLMLIVCSKDQYFQQSHWLRDVVVLLQANLYVVGSLLQRHCLTLNQVDVVHFMKRMLTKNTTEKFCQQISKPYTVMTLQVPMKCSVFWFKLLLSNVWWLLCLVWWLMCVNVGELCSVSCYYDYSPKLHCSNFWQPW